MDFVREPQRWFKGIDCVRVVSRYLILCTPHIKLSEPLSCICSFFPQEFPSVFFQGGMAESDPMVVSGEYFEQDPNFDHSVCTCNGKICGLCVFCFASVETSFNLLMAERSRRMFARLRALFLGLSRFAADQLILNVLAWSD